MQKVHDVDNIARVVVGPDDRWATRDEMQVWSELSSSVRAQLTELRDFLWNGVRLGPGVSLDQVFPFESIRVAVRDAIAQDRLSTSSATL